ncbi:MAG: nuclear transport factor 2 family protein [Bacteroidales bacterium]|nr:nuclear transport factor 2 family protein [Bacteroidales bacterium]
MSPKELIQQWVFLFNKADAEGISNLYADDAVNHQVVTNPVRGKQNIKKMFENEFAQAEMTCIVEHIYQDGTWGILEWKDPLGLRGCGFFHIIKDKIAFQRGYWDQLSFLRQHHLPLPEE